MKTIFAKQRPYGPTPTRQSHIPRWFLGLALFVIAGVVAACGDSGSTTDAEPDAADALDAMTLMLNWSPNAHHAGIYAALSLGLYEEQGINLELIEPSSSSSVEQALAAGQVHVGISQAESLIPARAVDIPVVAIATLFGVNDSALMADANTATLNSGANLSGLTYGGWGAAFEEEIIAELLRCEGVDPSEMDFVEVGDADYLVGFDQGHYDVAWVFNGWDGLRATEILDRDMSFLSFKDHLDCIPNWYTPIFIASEAYIGESPYMLERFLAATADGYQRVAHDPTLGITALTAAAPELDADLVDAAVNYYSDLYLTNGEFGVMEEDEWQAFIDFLSSAGIIDVDIKAADVFTNEFLPHSTD